ncbi:MAG TPA: hypothetical protein VFN50_07850 [Acidimicrobiales bacterium]|nr:hypothetical protein [Acidimicrobiales bacterium]
MRPRLPLRHLPQRVATGAFILHSGLEKWKGDSEQAERLHGFASGAYPQLASLPSEKFLRALALGEIVTGGLLVAPVVPSRLAGAALTAFAGGLMGLYVKTPSMRRPGSIWPTQAGLAVSKDVWMLGIGLGMLLDRS